MLEISIGLNFVLFFLLGLFCWRVRKQLQEEPRAFFMDWPDISDEYLFPGAGWYLEWRGLVIGPFTRSDMDLLLRCLQHRRK